MALLESNAFVEVNASMAAPLRGKKRWAYLERQKTIRLATTNEDGSIYLSSLWYVVRDETIYLPVDAAGRHGVNFEAQRNFSALVDSGDESDRRTQVLRPNSRENDRLGFPGGRGTAGRGISFTARLCDRSSHLTETRKRLLARHRQDVRSV